MNETFWSRQVAIPQPPPATPLPDPVLEVNTTGDQQTNTIANIPGGAGGARPTGWLASAQAVYPRYGSAGFPAVDPSTLNLAEFSTWHSEHQRQFILAQPGPTPKSYRIPANGDAVGLFALVNNGTRPINLMNLTLTDYAMLPRADQVALRPLLQSPVSGTQSIANRLGLTTDKTGTLNAIDGLIAQITATPVSQINAANKAVFTEQLQILRRQVVAADMIIPDQIGLQVSEISKRFDRAKTFGAIQPPMTMNNIRFLRNEFQPSDRYVGLMTGVQAQGRAVSSDNNSTINAGFQEFMRAERAILAQQKRREGISASDGLRDPRLDVANLIYQLQLLYEGEAEGRADGGTEEIRQLHKLLQDYGIMQRLVQETIKNYDSSKPEEKRRFMNLGGRDNGEVITEQRSHVVGNQDAKIDFQLFDPVTGTVTSVTSPGGTADNGDKEAGATYRESPGYHWFHLQATNPGGTLFRQAGSGNPEGVNGFLIWQTFSRQYERHDGGLRVRSNPDDYGKQNGGLSAEEMRVFGMFSDDSWAKQFRQGHPIETFYGIDRPVQQFTGENEDDNGGLALLRKTVWDSFSTQLNDTVTLLNQRNQLQQNEIESATRQQNRHFDLGNNALKKMNDLLMTIGRM